MKATGIVRRIDDLGRVVIPKEIRRTMNLREGDPLEICTTDKGIVLTKYREETKEEFAKKWITVHDRYAEMYQARFTIERATTTCEVVVNGERRYGTAVCNPQDNFDASIGMAIALCRATNVSIPEELVR